MKKMLIVLSMVLVALAVFVSGCVTVAPEVSKTATYTAAEKPAVVDGVFSYSLDEVYYACESVLEGEGWRIKEEDKQTGRIITENKKDWMGFTASLMVKVRSAANNKIKVEWIQSNGMDMSTALRDKQEETSQGSSAYSQAWNYKLLEKLKEGK
jgi:hypothetical protein